MKRIMVAMVVFLLAVPATAQQVCPAENVTFRVAHDDGLAAASRYRVMYPDSTRTAHQAVDTSLGVALKALTPGETLKLGFLIEVGCSAWVPTGGVTDTIIVRDTVVVRDTIYLPAPDSTPPPSSAIERLIVLPPQFVIIADSTEQEVAAVLYFENDARPYACGTLDAGWDEALILSGGIVEVRANGATLPGPCFVDWDIPDCEVAGELVLTSDDGQSVRCEEPPMRTTSWVTAGGVVVPDGTPPQPPPADTAFVMSTTATTATVEYRWSNIGPNGEAVARANILLRTAPGGGGSHATGSPVMGAASPATITTNRTTADRTLWAYIVRWDANDALIDSREWPVMITGTGF